MDESEEQETLLSKALGVYEDVSGYNPEDSPSNGFEYLHQVICENSKLPKTMVAVVNLEKYKSNQTYYVHEKKQASVKIDLLPTQEWQQIQLKEFIILRDKVSYMKEVWGRQKHSESDIISLPSDDDDNAWLAFCNQSPPLLQVLFSLQQPGIIKLINLFSSSLAEKSLCFSKNSTMWLYSLFAGLEEPLWPSTCGDLREILQLAREERVTIENVEDPILVPLNLIICVGSRYFRQVDLGD